MSSNESTLQARRRRATRRTSLVAVGAVAVLAATGSVAYALWGVTGSGSVEARSVATSSVSLTPSNVTVGDLYPGGTGSVTFTVSNPNAYAVELTTLTLGAAVAGVGLPCPDDVGHVAGVGELAVSVVVPAKTTTQPVTVSDAVQMSPSAPPGCADRTFIVAATAAGTQVAD